MSFKRTYTYPYPPNLGSLPDVEIYLKKLYESLLHNDYSSEQVATIGGQWITDANGIHYPAYGLSRNVGIGSNSNSTNALYVDGNVLAQDDLADPYIEIRNESDSAYDPHIRFSLGATPETKFSVGVNSSDHNTLKIIRGTDFGLKNLLIINPAQDFAGVAELTEVDSVAGPASSCYACLAYGDYVYVSSNTGGPEQDRIYKYKISDGTLVATSPSVSGTTIRAIFTDGDYLYVHGGFPTSANDWRIRRYGMDDLTYDTGHQSEALSYLDSGSCYYEGHIYTTTSGSSPKIRKIRCSDLSTIWTRTWTTGSGDSQADTLTGIATDGIYIYLRDSYSLGNKRIIRCDMDGIFVDAHNTETDYVLGYLWHTFWYKDGYLYSRCNYDTSTYLIVKISTVTFSIEEEFAWFSPTYQASTQGDYVYVYSAAGGGNKVKILSNVATSAAAYGSTRFYLPDAYSSYNEIARLTSDKKLGVGTSSPTETIEALGNIKSLGGAFISTVATGTSPYQCSSTTVNTNLNADLIDGYHYTEFPSVHIEATDSPDADDDIDNYREGTIWVEQDSNTVWFCADNADGAAVWHGIDQDLRTTDGPTFTAATCINSINIERYDDTDYVYPLIGFAKYSGTQSSPGDVAVGDYLGGFVFYGQKDSSPRVGGYLYSVVSSADTNIVSASIGLNTTNSLGSDLLALYVSSEQNIGVGQSTFGTSATNTIAISTGTAPSTSPADCFQVYSADVVAGNAAPHFRTEAGDVVKLYKYVDADFANTPDTGDADTDDLISKLVSALTALGVIASS